MRRVLLLLTLITPLFAACGDDADSEARGPDVTVADLNVLHGLFCPRETENCRLADRIDLLFQWIAGSGCPDVVTLQEGTVPVAELVAARAGSACPFPYEVVLGPHPRGIDDEIVLTRYPVSQVEQRSSIPASDTCCTCGSIIRSGRSTSSRRIWPRAATVRWSPAAGPASRVHRSASPPTPAPCATAKRCRWRTSSSRAIT